MNFLENNSSTSLSTISPQSKQENNLSNENIKITEEDIKINSLFSNLSIKSNEQINNFIHSIKFSISIPSHFQIQKVILAYDETPPLLIENINSLEGRTLSYSKIKNSSQPKNILELTSQFQHEKIYSDRYSIRKILHCLDQIGYLLENDIIKISIQKIENVLILQREEIYNDEEGFGIPLEFLATRNRSIHSSSHQICKLELDDLSLIIRGEIDAQGTQGEAIELKTKRIKYNKKSKKPYPPQVDYFKSVWFQMSPIVCSQFILFPLDVNKEGTEGRIQRPIKYTIDKVKQLAEINSNELFFKLKMILNWILYNNNKLVIK